VTGPSAFTVLCCRAGRPDPVDGSKASAAIAGILAACVDCAVEFVGSRPGKSIDPLLAGRVLVVGEDADLAAVALRLLRRERLGAVEVGYASPGRTAVTDLWGLPRGCDAARLALTGRVEPVPLVRDDVGGVLVGVASLGPLAGTVYVDEHRVLQGSARELRVRPDLEKGLAVTVTDRRLAGLARRSRTTNGRAVQIGCSATTVVRDSVAYPRPMERWTFYKHTEPLRLVRGTHGER
jgi:hypothetical protein